MPDDIRIKGPGGMDAMPLSSRKASLSRRLYRQLAFNWEIYLLLLLPILYLLVFKYYPMYGVQIAFKNYRAVDGITGSAWVGFRHFATFFRSYLCSRLILNTLGISVYALLVGFPIPIVLALLIHYMPSRRLKKTVQTVSYAPHFISVVVMSGMVIMFLGERSGIINNLLAWVGLGRTDFMAEPQLFSSIYVWSGIWQGMGYGSIIYIAALAGVDVQLHEAAIVDGATILKRIWHVDLPSILPTIVILLILSCGQIFNVGFEKVLLLQNALNNSASEIISTYVYKIGIANSIGDYSYPAAIGLFTSVINLVLLSVVNFAAKRLSGNSLW